MAIPTADEVESVEHQLAFRFPASYREFLALDGLSLLDFDARILSPTEILAAVRFLPDRDHVPFGDNGCGDLYCWPSGSADPAVVFFDHETQAYSPQSESFLMWLHKNRRR